MQEKVQDLLEFDQVIYCDIKLILTLSTVSLLENINIFNFP